jgi:hypothetical protein
MIKEWPCTCLPAPFDEPCEGCKHNAATRAEVDAGRLQRPTWMGIDLASGPDMSVRAEFDADGNLLRILKD